MNPELFEVLNQKVEEGNSVYRNNFLKENNLDTFIKREEVWIKNNLDYLYSIQDNDIQLTINPYHKLVQYHLENENGETNTEYFILPKYLASNELYIHSGLLEKADLLIKVFIDYGTTFSLYEIKEQILSNSNPDRKNELDVRLQFMIKKFLSYQYLVIE